MQQQLSEILDNILGLLLLEGSYDINEDENGLNVAIETKDAGRLIGARGESLEALQLIASQILAKHLKTTEENPEFKRVIVDVMGWRKQKEEELITRAKGWAQQVAESKIPMELEPMPAWQRRVVHMTVQEMNDVESESIGEGFNRHLVIKPANGQAEPAAEPMQENPDEEQQSTA